MSQYKKKCQCTKQNVFHFCFLPIWISYRVKTMIWVVSLFVEDQTAAVFVQYTERILHLSGWQYNKISPDLHHVHVQLGFPKTSPDTKVMQIKHLFHEDIGIVNYDQTSVPHPRQSNKPSVSSSAVSQRPSLDNQINYWLSVLGTLNVALYYRSHNLDGSLMWSLCCPEIIYGAVSGFGQV